MAFAATRLHSYHALFCVSAVALVGSVVCIALIREKAAVPQPVQVPPAQGAMQGSDLSPAVSSATHT
jgi:hypothetical protein